MAQGVCCWPREELELIYMPERVDQSTFRSSRVTPGIKRIADATAYAPHVGRLRRAMRR